MGRDATDQQITDDGREVAKWKSFKVFRGLGWRGGPSWWALSFGKGTMYFSDNEFETFVRLLTEVQVVQKAAEQINAEHMKEEV